MRIKFTLLILLLFFFFAGQTQKVTGIWRGYFIQNTFGIYEERYKFEIQIEQLSNGAIKGVTYSYKTTVFYGKADVQGLYTKKTKNLIINETKLSEVRISDESEPCLMTCYLDYDKMGSLETLTGTYTSRNLKTGSDCGNGKVFLERTETTDFTKEDFLVKKENATKSKALAAAPKKTAPPVIKSRPPATKRLAQAKPKTSPSTVTKAPATRPLAQAKPNTTPPKKAVVKPGAEGNLVTKSPVIGTPKMDDLKSVEPPAAIVTIKPLPRPEVIKRRANEMVKTITTSAKEIKIQLYDNGEIDGDTITVYHNNRLIVSGKRLTDKPITFTIKADEGTYNHEFVLVADNLGSIPPNTALMVVTAGDKRYELFISSSDKKNAVVQIEYVPEK